MCTEGGLVRLCFVALCTEPRTAARCGWCDGRVRSFLKKICVADGFCRPKSALGPLTDASGEFFDVIEHLTPFGHLGKYLSLGVHDGGVVTAERLADLG